MEGMVFFLCLFRSKYKVSRSKSGCALWSLGTSIFLHTLELVVVEEVVTRHKEQVALTSQGPSLFNEVTGSLTSYYKLTS